MVFAMTLIVMVFLFAGCGTMDPIDKNKVIDDASDIGITLEPLTDAPADITFTFSDYLSGSSEDNSMSILYIEFDNEEDARLFYDDIYLFDIYSHVNDPVSIKRSIGMKNGRKEFISYKSDTDDGFVGIYYVDARLVFIKADYDQREMAKNFMNDV